MANKPYVVVEWNDTETDACRGRWRFERSCP